LERKRIARKLDNPRLVKVTFTSIRHWKATMEYHHTQDILHVKQLLGHKRIGSTMVYIDIERALYGDHEDDDFISRCTRSDKGARALIDVGFEYVCTTPNDTMLFRKRK
jgi:integrase